MSDVRALDILEHLAALGRPARAADIGQALGIPSASLFRTLRRMLDRGFLQKDPAGYRLGLKILTLAYSVSLNLDLRDRMAPAMHRLLADSGETVELAIPDGDSLLFIDKLESSEAMRIFAAPGRRFDQHHATGPGKVLLAFTDEPRRSQLLKEPLQRFTRRTITDIDQLEHELDLIRRTGVAMDDQEGRIGVRRFTAPVFDHRRQLVAVIGFAGPSIRLPLTRKDDYSQMVLHAGQTATLAIQGHWPTFEPITPTPSSLSA